MSVKHRCEKVAKPDCPKCTIPMSLKEAHRDKTDGVVCFFVCSTCHLQYPVISTGDAGAA